MVDEEFMLVGRRPRLRYGRWKQLSVATARYNSSAVGTYVAGSEPSDQANNEIRATIAAGLNSAGVCSAGGWLIWPLLIDGLQPTRTGTLAMPFHVQLSVTRVTEPTDSSFMFMGIGITPRGSDFSTGNDWLVSGFNRNTTSARTYQFGRFGGSSTNVAGAAGSTATHGGPQVEVLNGGTIGRGDSMFMASAGGAPSSSIAYNVSGLFSGTDPWNVILSFMTFGGAAPANTTGGVSARYRAVWLPEAA